MKVRFKTGKFDHTVAVCPGDEFHMSLKEWTPDGLMMEHKVSEQIRVNMLITDWVMFYIPGVNSIGGIFGGPEIVERINEIFVETEQVPAAHSLFYGEDVEKFKSAASPPPEKAKPDEDCWEPEKAKPDEDWDDDWD